MPRTFFHSTATHTIILVFAVLTSSIMYAQLSEQQTKKLDYFDKFIFNESLTPRQVCDSVFNHELFFGNHLLPEEFEYINAKFKKRAGTSTDIELAYMCAAVEVYWYSRNGRIGKSLVACDKFKDAVGENPTPAQQILVEEFYAEAYFRLGIIDKSLEYNRRLYYLKLQQNPTEDERAKFAAEYSWTLNQAAWEYKDTVLMDSCIFFRRISVDHMEKRIREGQPGIGGITDNFNTYLLALARRKMYPEVIAVGHRAWFLTDSLGMNKSPGDKEQRASFLAFIARGFLGLGIRDSAFYYHDRAVELKPDVFPTAEGLPFFYARLGDYSTAATMLKKDLFVDQPVNNQYDYDMLNYMYQRSAPIFVRAGMYEEASKCYSAFIAYRDSMSKLEEQADREFQSTDTELQIKEARHIADLEKQQIEAEALQQKQRQNFIIASVAIFAVLLLAFLWIMYNRFQLTKKQKLIIEEKNKEILDSITYAKRIQQAILPDESQVKMLLPNAFVLYKPKDIVAGDFYWVEKSGENTLIAAADCTGHGVPGAFMSLIGSKELSVASSNCVAPGEILSRMNVGVKNTLKQNHADSTRDSIDIALLSIRGTKLLYSGANRPLWIVRNGSAELEEIKASKMSVAGTTPADQRFEEHSISLGSGDTIYIFSDGYADQFGGEKKKKMTTARFRQYILDNSKMIMQEQHSALGKYFEEWKKDQEQVDDVLVIGIRIS